MAWRSSSEAPVGTMWRGHIGKSIFFTTKPQETGMGLAISRSIIESHGGSLWADANPGQGAIFFFTLPLKGEEAA